MYSVIACMVDRTTNALQPFRPSYPRSKITRSGEKCNPVGDGRKFCCGTERYDKGTKTPTGWGFPSSMDFSPSHNLLINLNITWLAPQNLN
jgi:hypothetical protein